VEQLENVDGLFAVLQPGNKLTAAIPYSEPEQGKKRTIVIGFHGYYVVPEPGDGFAGASPSPVIVFDRAYPNPFNPTTHITFGLGTGAQVSLKVYTVGGRLVREIYDGPLSRGDHLFTWDGRGLGGSPVASGVYFYELRADEEIATGKVLAIK
jgi:hypothetical protein